jgi:plastocyanin
MTVKAWSTVTWTNEDTARHTITADDGSFDSGSIGSGATYQQTFATAGTFAYHCAIHPSMTATITVTP